MINKKFVSYFVVATLLLLSSNTFAADPYVMSGKFIHWDGKVTSFSQILRYTDGDGHVFKGEVDGRKVAYDWKHFKRFFFQEKKPQYMSIWDSNRGKYKLKSPGTMKVETTDGRKFTIHKVMFFTHSGHGGLRYKFEDPITGELISNSIKVGSDNVKELIFDIKDVNNHSMNRESAGVAQANNYQATPRTKGDSDLTNSALEYAKTSINPLSSSNEKNEKLRKIKETAEKQFN